MKNRKKEKPMTWEETEKYLAGLEKIIKQLKDDLERNPELPE